VVSLEDQHAGRYSRLTLLGMPCATAVEARNLGTSAKGVYGAMVTLRDRQLWIFGVDFGTRLKQKTEQTSLLSSIAGATPFLAVGDFNIRPTLLQNDTQSLFRREGEEAQEIQGAFVTTPALFRGITQIMQEGGADVEATDPILKVMTFPPQLSFQDGKDSVVLPPTYKRKPGVCSRSVDVLGLGALTEQTMACCFWSSCANATTSACKAQLQAESEHADAKARAEEAGDHESAKKHHDMFKKAAPYRRECMSKPVDVDGSKYHQFQIGHLDRAGWSKQGWSAAPRVNYQRTFPSAGDHAITVAAFDLPLDVAE